MFSRILLKWRKKPDHPLRDKARERMHRRAQSAEGAMERARFWIECIQEQGRKTQNVYLIAIATEALRQMDHKMEGD